MNLVKALIALILLLTTRVAMALPNTTPNHSSPLTGSSILQVFLVLALTIGLILISAYFVRRMSSFSFAKNGTLKVLTGLSLGTRERILLLEAGDTQILVGVSPAGMSTLHVFPEPILKQPIKKHEQANFFQHLKTALGKEGK